MEMDVCFGYQMLLKQTMISLGKYYKFKLRNGKRNFNSGAMVQLALNADLPFM